MTNCKYAWTVTGEIKDNNSYITLAEIGEDKELRICSDIDIELIYKDAKIVASEDDEPFCIYADAAIDAIETGNYYKSDCVG